MDVKTAYEITSAGSADAGRFYSQAGDLSLGTGLILSSAAYPTYSVEDRSFLVVEGLVYVLTHECDLAAENERPFNDYAVVCPIIPMDTAVSAYEAAFGEVQAFSFFDSVGKRLVERVMYLPPISKVLPFGGLLYFGLLTNTHISELEREGVGRCAAVTAYGLRAIDLALESVLRRPKSEALALV